MFLVSGSLTLSEAALHGMVAGAALARQLGEPKTRKVGAAAGDIRELGQHQLVTSLSREQEADGARGQDSCFPCE